jgi:hypothetical protein
MTERKDYTPKQMLHIEAALECYALLRAGRGSALFQVPQIWRQLQKADVTTEILDPTRTAESIDNELSEKYLAAAKLHERIRNEINTLRNPPKAGGNTSKDR